LVGLGQGDFAHDGGQGQDVDLWRGEGREDGQGVVYAGGAVDDGPVRDLR